MANTVRRTSEPVRDSHLWARLLWALDTTTQEVLGAVRARGLSLGDGVSDSRPSICLLALGQWITWSMAGCPSIPERRARGRCRSALRALG